MEARLLLSVSVASEVDLLAEDQALGSLWAARIGPDAVALSWEPGSDSGLPPDWSYQVRIGTSPNAADVIDATVDAPEWIASLSDDPTAADGSLQVGATYHARVDLLDDAGRPIDSTEPHTFVAWDALDDGAIGPTQGSSILLGPTSYLLFVDGGEPGRLSVSVSGHDAPITVGLEPIDGTSLTTTTTVAPRSIAGDDRESDSEPDVAFLPGGADLNVHLRSGPYVLQVSPPSGTITPMDLTIGFELAKRPDQPIRLVDPTSPHGDSRFPSALASGDLDGDGVPDLIVVDRLGDTLSLLRGLGDGSFQPEQTVPTGDYPVQLDVDDLNGDGALELLTVNRFSNDLSLFLNDGIGFIQESETIALDAEPSWLERADVDGDGLDDLVVAHAGSGRISVLRGLDGPRQFEAPVIYDPAFDPVSPIGFDPVGLAVGDLDGDSAPEIVVADAGSTTLRVLVNRGDGTFETGSAPFEVSSAARTLALADLDVDGSLEVLVGVLGAVEVVHKASLPSEATIDRFALPNGRDGHPVEPGQILVGDLDEDGLDDLMVTDLVGKAIAVLFHESNGGSDAQVSLGSGFRVDLSATPRTALALDVDGNGRLDIVIADGRDGRVAAVLDIGTESQRTSQSETVENMEILVELADVNGDGFDDRVTALPTYDMVSVALGLGNGEFATPISYRVGPLPKTLVVADIDVDGDLDLITANRQGKANKDPELGAPWSLQNDVSILLNRGDGRFDDPIALSMRPPNHADFHRSGRHVRALGITDLEVVDLDSEGWLDLVSVHRSHGSMTVLMGLERWSTPEQLAYRMRTVEPGMVDVEVDDVDGDGWTDFLLLNADEGTLTIVRRTARPGFDSGPQTVVLAGIPDYIRVPVGRSPIAMVRVVLDPADSGPLLIVDAESKDLRLVEVDLQGNLKVLDVYALEDEVFRVRVADLNADGLPDAVGTVMFTGLLAVLPGRAGGRFGPAETFDVGRFPRHLTVGDVQGDGHLDVLVANQNSGDLSLLLGMGTGEFETERRQALVVPGPLLALADVNGDARVDFLSAHQTGGAIVLHRTRGDGDSQEVRANVVGQFPWVVESADVDGDGAIDLVTANEYSADLTVLRGRGDGTFNDAITIPIGGAPRDLALADVNGDRRLDAVVVDRQRDALGIFFGRGDGVFLPPEPDAWISVGAGPIAVELADLNGDTILDAVVVERPLDQVRVLLGTVDGRFEVEGTYRVGRLPVDLVVADLDGDDHPDLAVLNEAGESLTTLINRARSLSASGNGGRRLFRSVGESEAGRGPLRARVTHLNPEVDAIPDLVVASSRSDAIAVLLGRGDGRFEEPVLVEGLFSDPHDVAAIDMDRDGLLDLVAVSQAGRRLIVARGLGNGAFSSQTITVETGQVPHQLVVDDWNADGRPDVAVANLYSDDLSVFLNFAEDRMRLVEAEVMLGVEERTIAMVDLNGDGLDDLIGVLNGAARLVVRPGLDSSSLPGSSAAFDAPIEVWIGSAFGRSLTTEDMQASVFRFVDLNGDGDAEIVALDRRGGQVVVLDQGGDDPDEPRAFRFEPSGRWSVPELPTSLVVTDLDGDDLPDLVVGLDGPIGLFWLAGRGSAGLSAPSIIPGLAEVGPVRNLEVVDVDLDGDPDLVGLVSGARRVLTWQNDGAGRFDSGPSRLLPSRATEILVASARGTPHGRPSLLAPDATSERVWIVDLGRTGDLSALRAVDVPGRVVQAALVDLDGDGRLDLVTQHRVSESDAGPAVYAVSPWSDGRFDRLELDIESHVDGLIVGDFDGDRRDDLGIVRLDSADGPSRLDVFLRDDRVRLAEATVLESPSRRRIALVDLEGAGRLGVLALTDRGELLYRRGDPAGPGQYLAPMLINPGQPAYDFAILEPIQPGGPSRVAILNKDAGRITVLGTVVSETADALPVGPVPQRARGAESSGPIAETGGRVETITTIDLQLGFATRLIADDVDGDGRSDLLALHPLAAVVSVVLGGVEGGFEAPRRWVLANGDDPDVGQLDDPDRLAALGLADLTLLPAEDGLEVDGASTPTLAISDARTGRVLMATELELPEPGASTVLAVEAIAAGLGPEVFQAVSSTQGGSTFWQSGSADQTRALIPGHFTSDDAHDLLMVNLGSGSLGHLVNSDGAGFGSVQVTPLKFVPRSVRAGDQDGDGLDELVVLGEDGRLYSLGLDAEGRWSERAVGPEMVGDPLDLVLSDVDGDGFLDALVTNAQGDVLRLSGRPDGVFEEPHAVRENLALVVADLDGDGRDDRLFSNGDRDRVSVQWASEDDPRPVLADDDDALLAPGAVEVADLNGDGRLDLIVADAGGNSVFVYPGLDGGRFGPALDPNGFHVGTAPSAVTIEDLDGDGRPDLVVPNRGSNDVTVLRNVEGTDGHWTFQQGPRLQTCTMGMPTGPVAAVVEDLDGDGLIDLIVANSFDDTIAMLPGLGAGFFDDTAPSVIPIGQGGVADLLFGQFDTAPGLDLLAINSNGNSLTQINNLGLEGPSGRQTFSSGGLSPVAATLFDVEGDGFSDGLLVANRGSGSTGVFRSDAQGFFELTETLPGTVPEGAVTIGQATVHNGLISTIVAGLDALGGEVFRSLEASLADLGFPQAASTVETVVEVFTDLLAPQLAGADAFLDDLLTLLEPDDSAGPQIMPLDSTSLVALVLIVPPSDQADGSADLVLNQGDDPNDDDSEEGSSSSESKEPEAKDPEAEEADESDAVEEGADPRSESARRRGRDLLRWLAFGRVEELGAEAGSDPDNAGDLQGDSDGPSTSQDREPEDPSRSDPPDSAPTDSARSDGSDLSLGHLGRIDRRDEVFVNATMPITTTESGAVTDTLSAEPLGNPDRDELGRSPLRTIGLGLGAVFGIGLIGRTLRRVGLCDRRGHDDGHSDLEPR